MDEQMKKDVAKLGSNQLIAHTMAARVLAQIDQGKKQSDIQKDLSRSKEALNLAQKAFFEKDPEAIEYLQLDNSE